MNRSRFTLVLALSLLTCTRAASASETTPSGVPTPTTIPALATPETGAPAPRLAAHLMTPMVAEMFAALEEQRAKMAGLRTELAQTRDVARVLELQRMPSAAKQETELRLLGIQADHARREGRLEVAARLDDAMRAMRLPAPVPAAVVSRPAPARATGR